MDERCYVETDGRIYLVRRGETLDLPRADELPFEIDRIAPLPVVDPVWFCVPRLGAHPHDWPSKDEVPSLAAAAPRVRQAVHATMPRVVTEAVCLRDHTILLVKANRGLTRNRWTLPGGFLRFGESPRDGVLRELREETGADGTVESLLDVGAKLGHHTCLHWIMLFFQVRIDGEPTPNPDEIAECRFVEFDRAADWVSDPLMRDALRTLSTKL